MMWNTVSRKIAKEMSNFEPIAIAAATSNIVVDLCNDDDDDNDHCETDDEVILVSPQQYQKERKEKGVNLKKRSSNDIEEAGRRKIQRKRQREMNSNHYIAKYEEEDVCVVRVVPGEVQVIKEVKTASPLVQVLEVFPDVQLVHAKSLLAQHQNNIAIVLQLLAEKTSYPKELNGGKKTSAARGNQGAEGKESSTTALIQHRNEHLNNKEYKFDFMSQSSFKPSLNYQKEAKQLLFQQFRFLSEAFLKKLFVKFNRHYAICHDRICQALKLLKEEDKKSKTEKAKMENDDLELEKFTQLQNAMTGNERDSLYPHQIKNLKEMLGDIDKNGAEKAVTTKRRRQACKLMIEDEILKEEHSFVQNKQHKLQKRMELHRQRLESRRKAIENKSTVECKCCYSDVSLDEMVQCREGHLFCMDCVRKFAETQIFGVGNFGTDPKTKKAALELLCLSGCGSGLQNAEKALPEKIRVKYHEMQFQAAVSQVQMDDLCSCPKCGYQAALPQTEMIFRCPVGDCGYESCRKCGEPPHIPLKCEEVEKKHQTKGRLFVEEAISEAKIRKCPKCSKKFVKESGCNKMTCSCGAQICYICRKQINDIGYQHFCQVPHCTHKSCNKCLLYSNAEEDDKRAMREAGIQAAEEVREESLLGENGTNKSMEVCVNVDDILGNSSSKTRMPDKGKNQRHRVTIVRPIHYPAYTRRRRNHGW